ncbi:MAG: hypothetical protein ACI8SR_002263 [Oceanicoccus sp.]|jgi:hypothetical protein
MVFWFGLGNIMSVVNDVLRDLHQRRTQRRYAHDLSFSYERVPNIKSDNVVVVFFIVCILLISSSVYFFVMPNLIKKHESFNDSKVTTAVKISRPEVVKYDDMALAYTKNIKPIIVDERDNIRIENHEVETQIKPSSKDIDVVDIKEVKNEKLAVNNGINTKKEIINVVIEDAVTLPSFARTLAIKRDPIIIKNRSQGENIIKTLMINEPEKVWPYIQKLLPKSNDNVSLLALGAQGEQRSNNHRTALSLYETLSEIEPNEAKWKVGSAISLDALSEEKQAIKFYEQSLELSPLPPALYNFVRQRIDKLKGLSHE